MGGNCPVISTFKTSMAMVLMGGRMVMAELYLNLIMDKEMALVDTVMTVQDMVGYLELQYIYTLMQRVAIPNIVSSNHTP